MSKEIVAGSPGHTICERIGGVRRPLLAIFFLDTEL